MAEFDENERLCIQRFNPSEIPHNCPNICALNLCKGIALNAFIEDQSFDQIIYCGDGRNDYCPATHLGSNDLLFMRKDLGLSKHMTKDGNKERIKCKLVEWCDHDELLCHFNGHL